MTIFALIFNVNVELLMVFALITMAIITSFVLFYRVLPLVRIREYERAEGKAIGELKTLCQLRGWLAAFLTFGVIALVVLFFVRKENIQAGDAAVLEQKRLKLMVETNAVTINELNKNILTQKDLIKNYTNSIRELQVKMANTEAQIANQRASVVAAKEVLKESAVQSKKAAELRNSLEKREAKLQLDKEKQELREQQMKDKETEAKRDKSRVDTLKRELFESESYAWRRDQEWRAAYLEMADGDAHDLPGKLIKPLHKPVFKPE